MEFIYSQEKELESNDLQLAENDNIEDYEGSNDYEKKRQNLKETKISRQTWSISEIYRKLNSGNLILNPDYQRNLIWSRDKKVAFVESLYMGIMIPPVYVVEMPRKDLLDEIKYEVVDGKQRLSSIKEYLENKLPLGKKNLEYFADLFGDKKFNEVKDIASDETSQMLSSILDIYVITSTSPVETKYDIFARLNKGAEKLKPNEIRRAIYHSDVTVCVSKFVEEHLADKNSDKYQRYNRIFTTNDIKRFEDYGRFYRSIAFYIQSNIEEGVVNEYNSRPRDMINKVLQSFQKGVSFDLKLLEEILETTLDLSEKISETNGDYIIDACIPFVRTNKMRLLDRIQDIVNDEEIKKSLEKSPSTTKNVNTRLVRVKELLEN